MKQLLSKLEGGAEKKNNKQTNKKNKHFCPLWSRGGGWAGAWIKNSYLESVHKYFVWGGGLGKMEGAKKVLSCWKGEGQKVFHSKGGGSNKFCQIESIIKVKTYNLLLKWTEFCLRLHLYLKVFPGPSAGPAYCALRLKCLCSHSLTYTW